MRVTILCAALLAPVGALAQTVDVNAMIHEGVELRRAHRDLEALTIFQRAWEASRAPRALAQVGFAELALGRWVDAEAHLDEVLDARDPWIEEHRELVVEALHDVRRHVGSLDVRANVAGAEAWIEGERMGPLPFAHPVRVPAGTAAVEVTAPGYLPVRRRVEVSAGRLSRETVTLVSTTRPIGVAPAVEAPGRTQRMLAWAAAGGAAVAFGVGVAGLVVRNNAVGRWNDDACLAGGRTRQQNCGDEESRAVSAGAVSIGGFVVGAALAVTSAVIFATAPSRRGRDVARFGCGVGPGDLGVACGGSL